MKIKWGERLGTGEVLLCWENCSLLGPGTKIGCNRQDASPGLVLVSVGHCFAKAECANAPFPIQASPGFGADEKLLQPTAVQSRRRSPPLNLTVICRNLVSSWSWQCWFGVSGVQDSLCVLQSHVLFLKRRCQLVGLGCRCDISRLEESEG